MTVPKQSSVRTEPREREHIRTLLVTASQEEVQLIAAMSGKIDRGRFHLFLASSTGEVAGLIEDHEINVVLLDLGISGDGDLAVFTEVYDLAGGLPVIVLTDSSDEEVAIKAVQSGAQDYMIKGEFGPETLHRCIRHAIERSRAEQALAQERRMLAQLMQTIPDRIYFKDLESRFVRVNHALVELHGLESDSEMLGKTDHDFFTPEHALPALEDEKRVIATGDPIINKVEKETLPDGRVRWALTTKMPLRGLRGEICGTFGISRDITELREAEDRLKQANVELASNREELLKALADLKQSNERIKTAQLQLIQAEKMQSIGRLAAGVAHEVKNPLAILRMGIDYLSQREWNEEKGIGSIVGEMREAVSRADRILGELLDFSRPENLELGKVDLIAVVQSALRLVNHQIKQTNVEVVTELSELPIVTVDDAKVEQVLINLLINACDAMEDGGTLTVRAHVREFRQEELDRDLGDRSGARTRGGARFAVIEILDTGHGIPPERMERIFDPFFTTKPTGKGTGLGLTVTKKIIELHGGRITVTPRDKGGTAVKVMLRI